MSENFIPNSDTKEPIVCRRCGTADNYHVEVKSNNHCAYCNDCGGFIKNIPYAEPTLYFGRYKGMKISDIFDKPYLEWMLKTVNLPKSTSSAISDQIKLIHKNG